MSHKPMYRLKCVLQSYDWGKCGSDSLVGRLAPEACGPDFRCDEATPYAELWMGTHPKGLAALYDHPRTSLASLLAIDTDYFLGPRTISKFPITPEHESIRRNPEIPYLFKILSVAKALPLQAHPDKKIAEELKASNYKNFFDANHKPEIALALGDFRGFIGFKPIEDISKIWENTPELREACGKEITIKDKESIKSIVSCLLVRPQSEIAPFVHTLVERSRKQYDEISTLVIEISSQYPGDVGILIVPFLMNLVKLSKGEAIYIGADEAHAYLSGDIVECMAASDNVVTAAFVPQDSRDPRIFTDMLTYTTRPAKTFVLPSVAYKGSTRGRTVAYDPPPEEFAVLHTSLDAYYSEEQLQPAPGPTIGIVLEGEVHVSTAADKEGMHLKAGGVVFVAAAHKLQLQALAKGPTEIIWSTVLV